MNLVLTPETWQPAHLRLQLAGRLDSETAPELERMLVTPLQQDSWRAVVLDCAELNYIASAGLRVVLMCAKRAQSAGTRLVVCGLQAPVREVFEISGFDKIIPAFATRAEAAAA